VNIRRQGRVDFDAGINFCFLGIGC